MTVEGGRVAVELDGWSIAWGVARVDSEGEIGHSEVKVLDASTGIEPGPYRLKLRALPTKLSKLQNYSSKSKCLN